jgi:hypothetical protein
MRRITSMRQNARCKPRFRELIDANLPAEELARLARVDALLQVAAARDQEEAARLPLRAGVRDQRGTHSLSRPRADCPSPARHESRDCGRARAAISAADAERAPGATNSSTWAGRDDQAQELKLTFRQLALVHKSLQAVKTLGALPPQDELLSDTMQLVDLAMAKAV